MSIEGATISAGPSMGLVGSSMGGFSSFGVELGSGIGLGLTPIKSGSTIVNEGPVAPAFLENTVPLKVGGIGLEVMKNPSITSPTVPEFDVASAIAEVESIMGIVTKPMTEVPIAASIYSPAEPSPRIVNMIQPQIMPIVEIFPKKEPSPLLNLAPTVKVEAEEEEQAEVAPMIATATLPKVEVVQISDSDGAIIVDNQVESAQPEEQQEDEEYWLRNVVDQKAMGFREQEFSVAIEKVVEEDGQVDGSKVVAALPEENEKDRSEVLKETDPYRKLPDGSLVEIKEEFAFRKFNSETEAKKGAWYLIQKKRAVAQKRKEGIPIEKQEIVRVHKYHKWAPNEVAKIRTIKKGVVAEEIVPIREPDLHPSLVELFK